MARHLITSALPYINGVKHLGNLVGSMLPADVYARFMRARGHEVLAICATDEHGTPAELAAMEAGQSVREYCDEQHLIQKDLGERFGLSWDHFGRTSRQQNHDMTNHFADKLAENGYLEERTIEQIYSPSEERFLPDRYVTGTCPHCDYDRARGDQCENCGRLLEPTQLINPRSTVTGATDLEVRQSTSVFLLQSALADEVRAWIEANDHWPTLPRSIALKWLDEGLHDRDITRNLSWGIPVNRPGLENKVWYVWFDAPIGYIGATREWADVPKEEWADGETERDWRSWWYDSPDVTYTEFMGKDNVAFHAVSFPITQIGSREPWHKVDLLKAFNWLTYYGGKFSTSQGLGVFMDDALELLPADYWRWYLIANAPESDDTAFTWPLFQQAINGDLVGKLGNFVNRTLSLTRKQFGEQVPTGGTPGAMEAELAAGVTAKAEEIAAHFERTEFRKATRAIRELWSLGDAYLEAREPWRLVKADTEPGGTQSGRDAAAMVLRTAINLIPVMAEVAAPVIPTAAATALAAVGQQPSGWPTVDLTALPEGHPFEVPPLLFRRIEDDEIEAWTARFGGSGG
ncbi:methionine--tRNA ligase [Euzebya tangerina]|uniref:methionine--tRNA ligase n=1 Tax=Euzebya tangerina TaxID=591198 RepID=UPI000E31A384|nr:methionine--tRNA ligase [Euzebya tangerina]